jgi:hypothetical protein
MTMEDQSQWLVDTDTLQTTMMRGDLLMQDFPLTTGSTTMRDRNPIRGSLPMRDATLRESHLSMREDHLESSLTQQIQGPTIETNLSEDHTNQNLTEGDHQCLCNTKDNPRGSLKAEQHLEWTMMKLLQERTLMEADQVDHFPLATENTWITVNNQRDLMIRDLHSADHQMATDHPMHRKGQMRGHSDPIEQATLTERM